MTTVEQRIAELARGIEVHVDAAFAAAVQARQRRRRWRRLTAMTVAAAAAGAAVVAGVLVPGVSNPSQVRIGGFEGAGPSPLAGVHERLVVWPATSCCDAAAGNSIWVLDLATGRRSLRAFPPMNGGDLPYTMIRVGSRLVFTGAAGPSSIPESLTGRPLLLGQATWFLPSSAAPGQVLLVHDPTASWGGSVTPVSVTDGRRGRTIPVPSDAAALEDTTSGLLLYTRSGTLELWRPAAAPLVLARVPDPASALAAVSPHDVAYATGCRSRSATQPGVNGPVGYYACSMLHVTDLAGRSQQFAAPAGTAGWVPVGVLDPPGVSPGGRYLALTAVLPGSSAGASRLYLVPLGRGGGRPVAVPSSARGLYNQTAWSADGSWLFYQGAGGTLRAYRPATGVSVTLPIRATTSPYAELTVPY
ncbi:MAG: TolB-like translocation protein [Acidimicrobiales bacterium]